MKQSEFAIIGKPIPRIDGMIKTKGEALYTTDISLPGMLYGKMLRSPYPHAKILRIDTSKAEKIRGVKAVITGKDTPDIKYGCMMVFGFPEASDQYFLARDRVRFVGDPVCAVAATDESIATEALEQIVVEYEELPAVFSIEEATKPDAVMLHENNPGNISIGVAYKSGDMEKAFKEAYYVREDTFNTQLVQNCCMEPQVCLSNFDSSGKLTMWSSTQAPFLQKMLMSAVLDIPQENVRVIKPHMGGGFGAKAELFAVHYCAALLSRQSGRPVLICHTREEEFAASAMRHPMRIELKIGVKKDGTIIARKGTNWLDGGAYNSLGPQAAADSLMFLSLPYRQPNVDFQSIRVYTNRSPSGAMRGLTGPQVQLATDIQLDIVAEELGMDPLDIKIKNGLKAGDVTASGLKMKSGSIEECLQKIAEESEWKNKYGKLPPLRGIGVGCNSFPCGTRVLMFGPATALATALIRANIDGTVTINTGASDIGQGSDTVICLMTSEVLGIKMEDVRNMPPDTDLSPPDYYTASSRVTMMVGNAVINAATALKAKLFEAVSKQLEANAKDLEAGDSRIYVKGSPEKGVSFREAVEICQMLNGGSTITAQGNFDPDLGPFDLRTGEGDYSPSYSFGAQVAEVEIDPDTGRVKIERILRVHDCGRVISLLGAQGQLEGSVALGIGGALSEKLFFEEGRYLNPSFLDYKFPTSMEIPDMENTFVESNDPVGPFGAKEVGEGCINPVAPAILGAIYNATGLRFKELPVTPEMILKGLKKMKGEE